MPEIILELAEGRTVAKDPRFCWTLGVWAAAGAALWAAGHPALGIAFFVVAVVSGTLNAVLD